MSRATLTPASRVAISACIGEVDFREARVSALGIIGADAIREAFDGELSQLRDLLQGAVRKRLNLTGDEDWYPYIHALFDDFVVIEAKDGKLMKYSYTVDGTDITLGEPVEVVKTFEPADGDASSVTEAVDPDSVFIEAAEGSWRIRVIQSGLSGNRNYYSDDVLREAAPMFDGVRVFVKSDDEHLAGKGKDFRNLIGNLSDISFVEGKTPDTGEVQGTLTLIEPEGDLAVKLREAWKRGLSGLFGFSIDAKAKATQTRHQGVTVREAKKFTQILSVDLIVEPGAGGGVIDLIEAQQENKVMDRDQIIALLEARGLLKGKNVDEMSDDQLTEIFTEAFESGVAATGDDANAETGNNDAQMREAVRIVEARAEMRDRVNRSNLPQAAKDRVIAKFKDEEKFTEAEVDDAITSESEYLAAFTESGTVQGLGEGGRIQIGETRFEKTEQMLEAFFDPENKDHRHASSFKECYIAMTGDSRVTGMVRDADTARMTEALDASSFSDVLGNSITRRMLADYNSPSQYDIWRIAANVVSINDFRTQERTRFGGYGDVPVVAESGDYTALTSPTDEKASYAAAKRGGTEKVTLEMIKNDDVGAIRRIPMKMSRASKRTLSKFVLDFFRTNPAIYDGVTLFHASHGNLGTAALDAASVAAGRLAMKAQQELDSDEPLGIGPKTLWVPDGLEETAVDLFRRNTENDKNFVQSLSLDVVPVWYWTDPNDWVMTADKNDVPTLELGFMDGQEEPELFVQDSPSVGSMFTNDETTYKLRHIYGGAPTDFRGAYKAVVA